MATKPDKESSGGGIQSLNAIINQNLTTVGSFNEDELNDIYDQVDMKSNVSLNWHRGSMSYSQPSSPKNNACLSPVTSVSSLSDLSNETYEGDSESCASLNSFNSADSALHDALHDSAQAVIHEHKENHDSFPKSSTPPYNAQISKSKHKRNSKHKRKSGNHSISKSISFENFLHSEIKTKKTKTVKTTHKSRKRKKSKCCLDITAFGRLTTKPIELWSVSDVAQWVKLIDGGKYKEYASNFRSKKIGGKKLYKMNRSILQSIEIYHPSVRKAILAALQRLKIRMRKHAKKKINIYAQKHEYDSKMKKKSNQHWRSVSSFRLKRGNKERQYVIAIKKKNHKPCINPTESILKQKRDISDFLGEFEIRQSPSSNINFIGSIILEQTDNFTMIKLSNKRIVYAMMKKVEKWNNNDVCKWLNSVSGSRFKKYIPKFQKRKTNGFDLLNISRVQLQNNIGMKDAEIRNQLLREIKLLKIETKPTYNKPKKRTSAVLMKDFHVSNLRANSAHASTKHRKSASLFSGPPLQKTRSYETRKLGPRDIGRINYKGTKYEKSMFDYDFLEEKINYKSTSAQFNKRKQRNPVQHKETVNEIGISADYRKPGYCNDVLRNMKRGEWLQDRPISRRNLILDKLKGTKIPKSTNIADIHEPVGWQPIEYKYKQDEKRFLEEHFWYDGSGVQFEFGFSRLLNCLPPTKVITLNKEPSPTGYESKLNWLKMLLNMVSEEMNLIHKEDVLYNVKAKEKKEIHEVCVESKETEEDDCNIEAVENVIENKEEEAEIENVESDSNDEILTPPRDLPNHDSNTMREMYKRQRNRANTTLAKLALSAVPPNSRPKTLTVRDRNRRRFLSQESVDSIQAIISNIEKKRAAGNTNP